MKRELQTMIFRGSDTPFYDYAIFIDENPYIEIVSVISNERYILVTYYE